MEWCSLQATTLWTDLNDMSGACWLRAFRTNVQASWGCGHSCQFGPAMPSYDLESGQRDDSRSNSVRLHIRKPATLAARLLCSLQAA
jgi:hypothetical protein